ncbi:hypothetical protein NL329_30135, partial [Klebsiella pneumoniae]|nr:hypothetical protein [Klebsiella pneumoniae]
NKHLASGSLKFAVQPQSAFVDAKETPATEVTLPVPANVQKLSGVEATRALGLELPELYVAGFGKKSAGKEAGLQLGDKIVAIDGTKV